MLIDALKLNLNMKNHGILTYELSHDSYVRQVADSDGKYYSQEKDNQVVDSLVRLLNQLLSDSKLVLYTPAAYMIPI